MNNNEKEEILFEIFGTKVKTMIVVLLGFVLFVGWLTVKWLFGVQIPGHWNEKANYKTQVYVNVFPNNDNAKNYRLIGDIERYSDCYDEYGCFSRYYVRRIVFPNKNYIEFDDCEAVLAKKESCTDFDGERWSIELTNQKL